MARHDDERSGGRPPVGDEAGDDFDALFQQMQEELGLEDEPDDGDPAPDESAGEQATLPEPPRVTMAAFDALLRRGREAGGGPAVDGGSAEEASGPALGAPAAADSLEPDSLEPDLLSLDGGDDGGAGATVEQAPLAYPTNATLKVQFAVDVAVDGGGFQPTEARGLLQGDRSYRMRIQDDFSFGFDARRNEYEMVLNPNETDLELREIEGDRELVLLCGDDGQIALDKPEGVRLDVYRIERGGAGSSMSALATSPANREQQVVLPTHALRRYDDFAEYMLGLGLAERVDGETGLQYAFSVYVAVKLARPAVGDGD